MGKTILYPHFRFFRLQSNMSSSTENTPRFSRLAAIKLSLFLKHTHKNILFRGVFVSNFGSLSFFVWLGGMTHINKYTHIQVKVGISSTGCSPHVDFENRQYDVISQYEVFFSSFPRNKRVPI